MSKKEKETEQAVQAVFAHAAQLLAAGETPERVEGRLVEMGLDRKAARTVVDRLVEVRGEARKEAARKNMLYGGLWCVGGLVVTGMTYSAASSGGGYVVAWGAIIFGAIQFFRGVAQSPGD